MRVQQQLSTPLSTLTPAPTNEEHHIDLFERRNRKLLAASLSPFTQIDANHQPVLVRPNEYDYAPAVIVDNGLYRMWWCGSSPSVGGDHILYAEAAAMAGPWHAPGNDTANSYLDVFQPTYHAGDFDAIDTCDPSVLSLNGTYYLYYGAYPADSASSNVTTIGVATSADGIHWRRAFKEPIVRPAHFIAGNYGAGQPSVSFVDPYVYMLFTDVSGRAGASNQNALYVLRSVDPLFSRNVEELRNDGFASYAPQAPQGRRLMIGASADWQFSDALDAFILAQDTSAGVQLNFFNRSMHQLSLATSIPSGPSGDGPGIASTPERHAQPLKAAAAPIEIIRAVSDGTGRIGPYGWDLSHCGITMNVATAPPNVSSLSPGVIVGIAMGSAAGSILLVAVFIYWICARERRGQATAGG